MKLTLRRDLGGYGLQAIENSKIDGLVLDKPFTLFTGPNGSGKSAALRGIRASIGINGERGGQISQQFQRDLDIDEAGGDVGMLATHAHKVGGRGVSDHVPAVFDLGDLAWRGQPTYLFDSRTVSGLASKADFGDDMGYQISMIVGGGTKVSHGQFVKKTWWECLGWAAGDDQNVRQAWDRSNLSKTRQAILDAALGGGKPSIERWVFIDEPETAIDAEALLIGVATLLELAKLGELRVFCASHSLLFAAGLIDHPKIQHVDMGGDAPWLETQRIALRIAGDQERIGSVGRDFASRLRKGGKGRK